MIFFIVMVVLVRELFVIIVFFSVYFMKIEVGYRGVFFIVWVLMNGVNCLIGVENDVIFGLFGGDDFLEVRNLNKGFGEVGREFFSLILFLSF